jgi:hypothetical protein
MSERKGENTMQSFLPRDLEKILTLAFNPDYYEAHKEEICKSIIEILFKKPAQKEREGMIKVFRIIWLYPQILMKSEFHWILELFVFYLMCCRIDSDFRRKYLRKALKQFQEKKRDALMDDIRTFLLVEHYKRQGLSKTKAIRKVAEQYTQSNRRRNPNYENVVENKAREIREIVNHRLLNKFEKFGGTREKLQNNIKSKEFEESLQRFAVDLEYCLHWF